jgi:glucosamine-6-phosphate deaminase
MDEYLGLDPANGRSMAAFLLNRVIQPLGINNFVPLPKSPEDDAFLQHERRIEQGGGLDLVVHGIGRNGHLGFNEPGSAFDSRTRVVELSPSTRQANQRFFSENEPTPGFGVTLGLGTMFAAERVILLASGEAKRDAIQRCVWGPSTLQTPASMLQKHPNIDVIIDQDACGWLEAVEDKSMAAIAGPDRVLDNLSTGSGSEGGTQIPIIGDEPLRRAA